MTSTAPISGSPQDPTSSQAASTSTTAGTSQAPSTLAGSNSDLRLVIEDDKAAGSYVYVTIDPATGKVVSQVPRAQLLNMKDDPSYTPGSLVSSVS